jgi:hypothetical protein
MALACKTHHRQPYIVEQHGAPVPRSTTGSYVSGPGQLFDCKHVAYHNLNQLVLLNPSVPSSTPPRETDLAGSTTVSESLERTFL